jgi:hypothetical protein
MGGIVMLYEVERNSSRIPISWRITAPKTNGTTHMPGRERKQ